MTISSRRSYTYIEIISGQAAERSTKMNDEKETVTLDEIAPGSKARIDALLPNGGMERRLADLGFCRGETVRCTLVSPLGDPRAYLIRGALIALRSSDAKRVSVTKC